MKRGSERRDECVRHKLEQLILSSFIYFIDNKSAALIFLNGEVKTFISAVLLAGQHTRRAVGRGDKMWWVPCSSSCGPALNWEKENELIPAFIFIVSGDSLTLQLIRWENWMAASLQHTQKNDLCNINQMI